MGRGKNTYDDFLLFGNNKKSIIKKPETIDEQIEFLTKNAEQVLPKQDLYKKLSQKKSLRIKFGIDPTASDIHLGHVVVLDTFRRFQDLGHEIFLVIGDTTASVGDPSGRSKTRPMVSKEKIKENVKTFEEQVHKILDQDKTNIVYNSSWLNMSAEGVFSLLSQATVAQILERDDFKKRINQGEPISMLEMVYPLLQAYDSVHLKADVEIGGTDQTFNLLLARDLQEKISIDSKENNKEEKTPFERQSQVVITMPILPGLDGKEKMSKSLNNYIGITDSASEMYGKILSISDPTMKEYYKLLLGEDMNSKEHPREAKRFLARSLVQRFHSKEQALEAESDFDLKFKKGKRNIEKIKSQAKKVSFSDVKQFESFREENSTDLVALLADSFDISRNSARKFLKSGAIRLEGEKISDLDVETKRLEGKLLSCGKRKNIFIS